MSWGAGVCGASLQGASIFFKGNANLAALWGQEMYGGGGLGIELKVGNKQVIFAGVLDDSNSNCVPRENVTMTFASGTTSLEAFLISQFGFKTCK